MAYFNAGAWWTTGGQAYSSEAEAEAAERSGATGTGSTADEFAKAMGQPNAPKLPKYAQTASSIVQPNPPVLAPEGPKAPLVPTFTGPLSNPAGASGFRAPPNQNPAPTTPAQQQTAFQNQNTGGAQSAYSSGGAQAPAVMAGFDNNHRLGSDPSFGQSVQDFFSSIPGLAKTPALIPETVPTAIKTIANQTAGRVATGIGNVLTPAVGGFEDKVGAAAKKAGILPTFGQPTTPNPTSGTAQVVQPPPLQAPVAPNTAVQAGAIARPPSTQQDSIVQQMLAQSQHQSAYNTATAGTSSAGSAQGFDASAGTAQGYTAQAGTSQGFDATGYAAQAGQAAQVLAESGQRNQARDLLLNVADDLNQASKKDNPDLYADKTEYWASKDQTNSIIQQLLAAAKMPEGPSAAESLMLTAQERAVRNAYGDAGSLGGGWRSQLTGQRRALGQAVTSQADIAAQLGALRAQETAANRDRQVTAYSNAGGLSNQLAGFDQGFAISDADRNAAIHTANQTNRREALAGAGALRGAALNSDTAFSTANADRAANTNIANAGFKTQANIATANNQTSASVASAQNHTQSSIANASFQTQASIASAQNQTSASQTNANNTTAASIASANNRTSASQTNANNQTASSIANAANATQTSISNANNRTIVDQNNAANTLQSLQNAGVLSSNTRQQDMTLSVAQANNLTQAAIASANLQGSVFATQMQGAIAQQDANLRQQQINNLQSQLAQASKGLSIGGINISKQNLAALQQVAGIISIL